MTHWIRSRPRYRVALTLAGLLVLGVSLHFSASRSLGIAGADEGQWPLSTIGKLELEKKGLEIPVQQIFNPKGESLVDAICRVGGATGSFVSADGLIITNHHVAFDGVQAASTPERDYLTRGFTAKSRAEELPAEGYTCRITESYRDVSREVLAGLSEDMAPAARAREISKRRRAIVTKTEEAQAGRRAEVAEMFQGSSYVLFVYREITDVRMVCIPPRSVGEYGGEIDNWIWPRHTGDFAFLRAYVTPDGSSAPYSKDNVPFRPKVHLEVNEAGVEEGDFVFLLGYPGRTYRNQPAAFVNYEETVRMPFYVQRFQRQLAAMNRISAKDPAAAIKLASEMKWRANVEKNYRGKLLGLSRLGLVDDKRAEEAKMQAWVEADPARKERWGSVLEELDAHYEKMRENARRDYIVSRLVRGSPRLQIAMELLVNTEQMTRPDAERQPRYRDRQAETRRQDRERLLRDDVPVIDQWNLTRDVIQLGTMKDDSDLDALRAWALAQGKNTGEEKLAAAMYRATTTSKVMDPEFIEKALAMPPAELGAVKDPMLELARALRGPLANAARANRERQGRLSVLMSRYLAMRRAHQKADFLPDANSTLRLTYGRIRGYSPRDGIWSEPFTTVEGILQKDRGEKPFDLSPELRELIEEKDFGDFVHPKLGTIPVGILYDCDTTGGNSGSPVLDAKGRLVGINFDRAFEATINDFRWSADYSRSIGVDVRYSLWITEKLMGAKHLLEEMGVSK